MLICPSCATPAVTGARFCFNCGTPLDTTAEHVEQDAERRIVTVLFGDLSDFTGWAEDLDPERVSVVTDRVLAGLARAVTDFGGYVDKLTGDGIMAIFGAPVAHEDDPERAVRAAQAMQDEIHLLVQDETGGGRQLGLRVGINTGEVLAGMQANLSYTVVGDTVNTAARLSDAASVGTTVAGRDTALSTMHLAAWRALQPLRLKGKRDRVQAYELVGLRSRAAHRLGLGEAAPFIGREAELGALTGRLYDVVDQAKPATQLVIGEAGIGKTRLVQELGRLAGDTQRARVLWGRCTPFGERRDLAPIADMVRTVCSVNLDDDRETATARVHRAVTRTLPPSTAGAVASAIADRLLDLLGYATEAETTLSRSPSSPGEPEGRRLRLGLDAVVELMRALERTSPLLLIVDDLHWATQELKDALRSVSSRLPGRVLLVGIGRSELLHVHDGWHRTLPDPDILHVHALDQSAAGRLLRGYLGGARLDHDVVRVLVERAQGNPFFLGELLSFLVDRGNLKEHDGTWQLEGELPEEDLPAGVQAVLTARIDVLDPASKSLLRDAAVLGGRFPVEGLAALGHHGITEALAHLESRHIVRPADPDALSYDFVHTLARDVAYRGLPKGERARRHAAAAGWFASIEPGHDDGVDASAYGVGSLSMAELDQRIAAQAVRAVKLAEEMQLPLADDAWSARTVGFRALSRSGRRALWRDDYRVAIGDLRAALDIAGGSIDPREVAEATLSYGEALAGMRNVEEAEAAIAPLLHDSPLEQRAKALVVMGDIRRKQGKDAEARKDFESALAVARGLGDDRLVSEALRHLGLLEYREGSMKEAEANFREAMQLAEKSGDQRGVGWALQSMAWSATTRGDYVIADECLETATTLFATLHDTGGISWCLGTEALVRLLEGNLIEARRIIEGLLPAAESLGDEWAVAACLVIDSLAASELGEMRVAAAEAERAQTLFKRSSDVWGIALAEVARGNAARGLGDTKGAQRYLKEAIALTDGSGHPLIASMARVSLGNVLLNEGKLDRAEQQSDLASELLATVDMEPHAVVAADVLRAMVLRQRGLVEDAIEILRECVDRTQVSSLLFPRRQVLAHLAGAYLELDDVPAAAKVIEEAMSSPAQDVRSRVVALRVLANIQREQGDEQSSAASLEAALALASDAGHIGEADITKRHM